MRRHRTYIFALLVGVLFGCFATVGLQPYLQETALMDSGQGDVFTICGGRGYALSVKPSYQPRINLVCKAGPVGLEINGEIRGVAIAHLSIRLADGTRTEDIVLTPFATDKD